MADKDISSREKRAWTFLGCVFIASALAQDMPAQGAVKLAVKAVVHVAWAAKSALVP